MRALLVALNAKYIHSNLAIYSIRAFSLAHGVPEERLLMAEYTINQDSGQILSDIFERQPELLAFSCYIWNIQQVRELAVELHKILPDTTIWLGGPEVSYQAEALVMECPWLTGVMVGEGEATFLELYQAYDSHNSSEKKSREPDLSGIPGIVYRELTTCKVITTSEREVMSMDELVFPYQYIDRKKIENRIIYYETSRGCPFGCSYCLSSVDRKVRLRSMSLVERELQFFLDHKVPQVKFVDRTFNCQREHTMAVWKYIYEHDNGITNFHFELSAERLTEEEIAFVCQLRPGLVQFEIGVQSVNEDTLKAIRRPCRLNVLRERVAKIQESGNIHQHLDLIAGLPWEDFASFRQSFNAVYAMKPDQFQLGFLKLLRGTPIFEQQKEMGIVCQDRPPYEVLFTKWLSYRDVLQLKRVEDMVERYYNSMQFVASLSYIERQFDTAFDFYQAIGEYYLEKGYGRVHQSRLQNYEILLAFCVDRTSCDYNILCQLMLYDLYVRENLKTRPSFLESKRLTEQVLAKQKERTRFFYQEEKRWRSLLPRYEAYDWKQVSRMTHLEYFDLDMRTYLQRGEVIKGEYCLLFDYQQRNPLNHQAHVIFLY